MTKSRVMWDRGLPGMGWGCRSPAGDWYCALLRAQTSQAARNSCVCFSSVAHQKKRHGKVLVQFVPAPRPKNWPKRSYVCSRRCPLSGAAVGTLLQICLSPWRQPNKALKASISLSSGYHVHSNGHAERANQDLESALRCVAVTYPSSWSTRLPWVEYAHNTLTCSKTGLSTFEASLGYQRPPSFQEQESSPI